MACELELANASTEPLPSCDNLLCGLSFALGIDKLIQTHMAYDTKAIAVGVYAVLKRSERRAPWGGVWCEQARMPRGACGCMLPRRQATPHSMLQLQLGSRNEVDLVLN